MTEIPDYVEIVGAIIRVGKAGCGISLKDPGEGLFHGGALFEGIDVAELRAKVNEAMHVAAAHFTECVTRADVEFTRRQILELSFRVVVYILIHRHIDGRGLGQPRSLAIKAADLRSGTARDLCWIYCETKFPDDYASRVAALAEMSLDQFQQYEYQHRPTMVDMGMLRQK